MTPKSRRPPPDAKVEALRIDGTLNRRADQITDPAFQTHDFFDARDVVQVKYEMLRRVELEAQAVAPTAAAFHFSRPSFYHAQRAFQQRGLAGLLPQKRGPHGGHKIAGDVLTFLQQAHAADGAVRSLDLARQVQDRFGLRVHPRSIERALARPEKKRRR
jgi:hypothetical protein